MTKTEDPIEILRQEYSSRRAKNPAYSLRAFARHLNLSPARLSQVLNRKRLITGGQIEKMGLALQLGPRDTKRLLGFRHSAKKSTNDSKYNELSIDKYEVMADWYYSGILCLLELDRRPKKISFSWIAQELGISIIEVNGAIERLVRLGLVEEQGDKLTPTFINLASPTDLPSPALRKYHLQMLTKAQDALLHQSVDDRSITGMTMAIDKKKLPEAKKLIQKFRRDLCKFLESGPKCDVYALNVQLFQLSK